MVGVDFYISGWSFFANHRKTIEFTSTQNICGPTASVFIPVHEIFLHQPARIQSVLHLYYLYTGIESSNKNNNNCVLPSYEVLSTYGKYDNRFSNIETVFLARPACRKRTTRALLEGHHEYILLIYTTPHP